MALPVDGTAIPCGICARILDHSKRKPHCTSCAQALLYHPRLQQVSALLDRENAHARVEAMVRPGNDGILAALPPDADFDAITAGINSYSVQRARNEREVHEVRIAAITEKADELRKQIEAHRGYIAAQRQDLDSRRSQLRTQTDDLRKRQPGIVDPVRSASKKAAHRLERARDKLVDARLVLCREAALACNFSRRKRSDGRSDYILGAIAIPDLRELNIKTQPLSKKGSSSTRTVAEPHELVSEAFDNVARLVSLCAHYLQVRPPAEIILPHEDFPRAVIMPERSSYKLREVVYPGFSTSQSSSPATSRVLDRNNQPRPRPLHLDRPLAQLFKEDPKSYGLFIEGAALLAWDVAWLCKTQGLETVNSFEDFCSVGRNLWHLLMMQSRPLPPRPSIDRRVSTATTTTTNRDDDPKDAAAFELRLGVFSHASNKYNLHSVEGAEILRDWRLGTSAARLTDRLKSFLLTEISGAEWDLLDEAEWAGASALVAGGQDRTMLVNGLRVTSSGQQVGSPPPIPTQDGTGDTDSAAEVAAARRKSGSGWMKVRGRNNET